MGKSARRIVRKDRVGRMNPNNPAHASSRSNTKAMKGSRNKQLNPNSPPLRPKRPGVIRDLGEDGGQAEEWLEETYKADRRDELISKHEPTSTPDDEDDY
jgi:hypothetical protein